MHGGLGGHGDLVSEVKTILGEAPNLLKDPPVLAPPPPATAVIERDLKALIADSRPKGLPLKGEWRQMYLTRRPDWYKEKASLQYQEATDKVRRLYRAIEMRSGFAASEIKALIASFLPLLKTDRSILLNLANLPSAEKDHLFTHSINTCMLSITMATHEGYSEDQAMDIAVAALLLDIGMIRVPEVIVSKAGTLTKEELHEVHKHPLLGADLITPIRDLSPAAALAIFQHHERLSGTGYPRQRAGDLIHDWSRIMAIADTYSAMVANRSYRKRMLPYEAMSAILKMGAAGLLDAGLIRRLLETLSLFPVGSLVRLQSGAIGKIIRAHAADFTKPTLAVLFHPKSRPALPGTVLDLMRSDDRIAEALDPDAIPQSAMDGF